MKSTLASRGDPSGAILAVIGRGADSVKAELASLQAGKAEHDASAKQARADLAALAGAKAGQVAEGERLRGLAAELAELQARLEEKKTQLEADANAQAEASLRALADVDTRLASVKAGESQLASDKREWLGKMNDSRTELASREAKVMEGERALADGLAGLANDRKNYQAWVDENTSVLARAKKLLEIE